jgi:HSP20 family molecular chaperone IbpA
MKRDISDIDEVFKLMDKIINSHFTGGYETSKNSKEDIYDDEDEEIVDIYEDSKHIYITVELRGVQEEDIDVEILPEDLIIKILYNGRVLDNKIKLPCKVKKKGKINYNNYILDVILTKDKRKGSKNGIQKGRKKSR